MILDERTYTLVPGKVPEFLARYEQEGLEVQQSYLGRLVGYFTTEIGTLDQVVHLWAYDDMSDREKRRAALDADDRWQAFLGRAMPLIVHRENRLLVPVSFSPQQ